MIASIALGRIGSYLLLGISITALFYMASVLLRAARDNRKRLEACEDRECEYFTDYLQKGPADLSHSQYHAAANTWAFWYDRQYLLAAKGGSSERVDKMCALYGQQARLP